MLLHPRVSLLTFTWPAQAAGYCTLGAMGTSAIFCSTHYLNHGNILGGMDADGNTRYLNIYNNFFNLSQENISCMLFIDAQNIFVCQLICATGAADLDI